jgi:hypothetical protein
MKLKEIAEFLEVSEDRALEILNSAKIKPESVDTAQLAALHKSMQGTITAPTKPSIKPVQTTAPIAPIKAETAPVASQPQQASGDEAELRKQIEAAKSKANLLRLQAELKAAEMEVANAQADLVKVEEIVAEVEESTLQASEGLATKKAAIEIRKQNSPVILERARKNGQDIGQSLVNRTLEALDHAVTISEETPIQAQIGVERMTLGKHRALNEVQAIRNQTPALLQPTQKETPVQTLEAVAV